MRWEWVRRKLASSQQRMGKADKDRIQTIALLLSEPRRKPSLVVAPVVALMQWKHEIENNTDGFTVCVWHGQGRMKAAELKKYDVVSCLHLSLLEEDSKRVEADETGTLLVRYPRSLIPAASPRVQEGRCVHQRTVAYAHVRMVSVSPSFCANS